MGFLGRVFGCGETESEKRTGYEWEDCGHRWSNDPTIDWEWKPVDRVRMLLRSENPHYTDDYTAFRYVKEHVVTHSCENDDCQAYWTAYTIDSIREDRTTGGTVTTDVNEHFHFVKLTGAHIDRDHPIRKANREEMGRVRSVAGAAFDSL